MLLQKSEDLNAPMGKNMETPLHQAAMKSTPDCVRILMQMGAKTAVYTK